TFNMFAFVFAIASFYYLLRLVREGKTRDSLLLGLFLSLTVGTHNLTAVYVGLATILTFMLSFVAQLRLLPSTRAYVISVLVAGVLSIPYIPYYLYQYQISVHLGINYGQPAQNLITSLLYTNARTNQSLYLLIITSIVGLTACALKREVPGALVVIIPTIIANVLLTLLLNPVITNRAAYFLPIPLFASVSSFFSYSIAFFKTPFRLPNLFGFLLIALIISGFVVADVNRFESAISYYQIVDSHTLDALNWISSHTLRNDSVYTNFPGLSAWIAGYAERNVLFPSAPGYILTAPDYTLATAANTIDAGNYVLSSQQITIGDFFPSSIENPAVYINSLSGKQGLLFSDDDFNYVNFTDSSGLRSANMVSADFKIFDGFSHNSTLDSLQFNYSWAFAQGVRTVSLAPPNIIKFSLSIFADTSNNT